MSRVAKKPIYLSEKIKIDVCDNFFTVSGEQGSLKIPKFHEITVAVNDNSLDIAMDGMSKKDYPKAGLLRSLLNNAVQGVTVGFKKVLLLKGLGFRCNIDNGSLVMSLGYSHKINYKIPADVKVSVEKDTIITVTSPDKQRVGQVAAEIRSYKIPDNYHAKGILYQDEVIILKEGKKK